MNQINNDAMLYIGTYEFQTCLLAALVLFLRMSLKNFSKGVF